mgnify:FL=1
MKQQTILSVFLSTFFLFGGVIFGQKTLNGNITDETGVPIPGATVIVVETNLGVISDFDGNYSISAEEGQSIEISYVGYSGSNKL